MSLAILAILAGAFAASLAVTALAWRAGVLDMPNARSSHVNPTPRAGGLGVMAGLGAGALAASVFAVSGGPLAGILIIAAAFAVMGFADDLITLGELGKFVASVCLCIALAAVAGPVTHIPVDGVAGLSLPVWLGWAGSALFVFVAVNAVNFMDGSDGMFPAVMIPASLGLMVAGLVAGVTASVIIGAALAAGLAGFILFNWNPARVFAGDVGALGAGAAYAGGALALAGHGFPGSLWLAPLFILVFLADVLLTLLRRARHGRFSLQAHREHVYQRLIDGGWSHARVALVYGGLTALIVLSGLAAAQGPDIAPFAAFCAWAVILTVLHVLAGRAVRS
ncbi:MAG: glycosyl transferase [Alphaproteobacteria bacterium]|nr:glycosyl transferase [Alphaproteobacteria bacterium]